MTSLSFEIQKLDLPGVLLIQPKRWEDSRGFFMETFHQDVLKANGVETTFIQDNLSFSRKNVLRGLHFQRPPHIQDKLVRCAKGEIFDVVADCNPSSPTYGHYVSVHLKGEEQTMLYIPGAYAHGFCVVSDEAFVEYKLSDTYHPESVGGVRFDDPLFNIIWPVVDPVISEQDTSWPPLAL